MQVGAGTKNRYLLNVRKFFVLKLKKIHILHVIIGTCAVHLAEIRNVSCWADDVIISLDLAVGMHPKILLALRIIACQQKHSSLHGLWKCRVADPGSGYGQIRLLLKFGASACCFLWIGTYCTYQAFWYGAMLIWIQGLKIFYFSWVIEKKWSVPVPVTFNFENFKIVPINQIWKQWNSLIPWHIKSIGS